MRILKGLEIAAARAGAFSGPHRRDQRLDADRMKTSIFSRAVPLVRTLVHLQPDARFHAGDIVYL
jgi:hypothetical protein